MNEAKITLLAGGVGGAKAAEGLAASRYRNNAAVVGNIGDDDYFHGLWVSPDIDTLIYSLADEIDRDKGWGRKQESYRILHELAAFGEATWMTLGDLDLATHIFRTNALAQGQSPSQVTAKICQRFNIDLPLLLPSDDVMQTQIKFHGQWQSFQSYFVREKCQPEVEAIRYFGADDAIPCAKTLEQLRSSDVILLAPSNPAVSIGAILAIPGIREAITESGAYVMAISPLINGKTVKGPADKMLEVMGFGATNLGIASAYKGLINGMVIDSVDSDDEAALRGRGLDILVTPTLMKSRQEKQALVEKTLAFVSQKLQREVA